MPACTIDHLFPIWRSRFAASLPIPPSQPCSALWPVLPHLSCSTQVSQRAFFLNLTLQMHPVPPIQLCSSHVGCSTIRYLMLHQQRPANQPSVATAGSRVHGSIRLSPCAQQDRAERSYMQAWRSWCSSVRVLIVVKLQPAPQGRVAGASRRDPHTLFRRKAAPVVAARSLCGHIRLQRCCHAISHSWFPCATCTHPMPSWIS